MAETIFFRLLASEDKGGALLDAIDALRETHQHLLIRAQFRFQFAVGEQPRSQFAG